MFEEQEPGSTENLKEHPAVFNVSLYELIGGPASEEVKCSGDNT